MALQLATAFIDIRARVGNIASDLSAIQKSTSTLAASLATTMSQLAGVAGGMAAIGQAAASTQKPIASMISQLSQFAKSTGAGSFKSRMIAGMTQFAHATGAAHPPLVQLTNALGIAAQSAGKASNAVAMSGRSAAQSGGFWVSLGSSVAGAGLKFFSIYLAIQKVMESIRSALAFQENMTHALSIQTGVTNEQRKAMEALARTLAVDLAFPVEDVAKGFFELAQAGFDANEQLKILPVTTKFARAGLLDVATATSLLNDATKASGLFVGDATQKMMGVKRAADVIARAAVLSNADLSEMAKGVARAGSTVAAFGADFEEMVATVAVFADVGRKSAAGGTAALIALRELQETAIKNQGAFKRLGVDVFDVNGKFAGMAAIIGQLEEGLAGMSDKARRNEIRNILKIDDRSVQFITSILGQSGQIRRFTQELKNAQGTIDQIARKQMEAFTRQLGRMMEQIKVTTLTILPAFIKPLIAILSPIASVIEAIGKMDFALGGFVSGAAAFLVAIKLIGRVVAPVVRTLSGLFAAFGLAGRGPVAVLRLLGNALLPKFIRGLAEIFHMVSIVGPAIEKFFDLLAEGVRGIPFVGGFFGKLIQLFGNLASRAIGIPLGAVIGSQFDRILAGIATALKDTGLFDGFRRSAEQFGNFFEQLGRVIVLVVDSIVKKLITLGSSLVSVFGTAKRNANELGIGDSLGRLAQDMGVVLKVMADNWKTTWMLIEETVTGVFNTLYTNLVNILAKMSLALSQFVEELKSNTARTVTENVLKTSMGPLAGPVADALFGKAGEHPLTKERLRLFDEKEIEETKAEIAHIQDMIRAIKRESEGDTTLLLQANNEELDRLKGKLKDLYDDQLRAAENIRNSLVGKGGFNEFLLLEVAESRIEQLMNQARRRSHLEFLSGQVDRENQRMRRMVRNGLSKTATAAVAGAAVPSKIDLPVFSALDELQKQIQEQLAHGSEGDKLQNISNGIEGLNRGIQENVAATKQVVTNTMRALPQGVSGVAPTPEGAKMIYNIKPTPSVLDLPPPSHTPRAPGPGEQQGLMRGAFE